MQRFSAYICFPFLFPACTSALLRTPIQPQVRSSAYSGSPWNFRQRGKHHGLLYSTFPGVVLHRKTRRKTDKGNQERMGSSYRIPVPKRLTKLRLRKDGEQAWPPVSRPAVSQGTCHCLIVYVFTGKWKRLKCVWATEKHFDNLKCM